MVITSKCRAVANYIIEKTNEYNEDETFREQVMMSCKRLLYFCNVKYLILHNGEFLFEDDFYAWPSGPVIPDIYRMFIQLQDGKNIPRYEGKRLKLTREEMSIIDKILEQTQELDTIDLINITNVTGGLWEKFYNEYDPEHNQIISKEEICNFYLNKEIKYQKKDKTLILAKR